MPGFTGIIGAPPADPAAFLSAPQGSLRAESVQSPDFRLIRTTLPAFAADKPFEEDERRFLLLEGTLLNRRELMNRYAAGSCAQLLRRMYEKQGIGFVGELRGDFSGAFFCKDERKYYLFVNQLGTKNLFYYYDQKRARLYFSTGCAPLADLLRREGYRPELDPNAALCMLTMGYMLEDTTWVRGIKKLQMGEILTFDAAANRLERRRYYSLVGRPVIEADETAAVDALEERFSAAVRLELDKDAEEDKPHLITLSGGLDSRQTLTYALRAGHTDLLTFTFAQKGSFEERIARRVAEGCGADNLFFSLGRGDCLLDLDAMAANNDGLVYYSGVTAEHRLSNRYLAAGNFGLMHTGMIGDAVLGSFLTGPAHRAPDFAYLRRVGNSARLPLSSGLDVRAILEKYDTEQNFAFVNRAGNCAYSGYRTIEQATEFVSPFLNVDFFDYAFFLDPRLLFGHRIYKEWILRKNPTAARYPWAKTLSRPGAGTLNTFLHRAGKKAFDLATGYRYSMNPMDLWWARNERLRRFASEYYAASRHRIETLCPALAPQARALMESGNMLDKSFVLTLLWALRRYFD